MSLSSKLRSFRKDLKKKKVGFDDEQLISVARNMPRDLESLGRFLSPEQISAFGDELLAITRAHTCRDQAKFEECLLEIGAFVRGGLPGMERLDRVYPRILKHYGVVNDMEEVFEALKLYVNPKLNKIKRKFVKDEEEEQEESSLKRRKLGSQQ